MKRWLNSVTAALHGIILFFKTERNARIEACIAIVVIALSFWLRISWPEFCLVLLCIGGVLSAEAFNTAMERLSDLVIREQHPAIGSLKDISAAAVLILSIISVSIGFILFIPKLLDRFGWM